MLLQKRGFRSTVLVSCGLGAAFVLAGLTLNGSPPEPPDNPSARGSVAAAPAPGAGLRAYLDPETGNGLAIEGVADFAGTGVDKLAVLGAANGTPRVWIVDAGSGAIIRSLNFPRKQLPVGFAIADSFGGSDAPEVAVALVGSAAADLLVVTATPRDRRFRAFMVDGGAKRARGLALP